jgi:nitrite reductase (NAD(P)H)
MPVSESELNGGLIDEGPDRVKKSENETQNGGPRKKVVVVGLGMVGISFM